MDSKGSVIKIEGRSHFLSLLPSCLVASSAPSSLLLPLSPTSSRYKSRHHVSSGIKHDGHHMTDTWQLKTSLETPKHDLSRRARRRDQVCVSAVNALPSNSLLSAIAYRVTDPPPTVKEPPDQVESKSNRSTTNAETSQPLAPPPRPAPSQQITEEGLDYFSTGHTNSHFSREPNPFEQSFGNPSSDLPSNKSLLPPVAALTSPAPLAGDGPATGGYGWAGSLRSGPLSPAMLGGPVGTAPGDYFDPSLRGSFPSGVTPNESSIRTGLTPGGGGSMFPAPSPNSQALYQQLASGGATPSTLDFHRTAMNAAAVQKANPSSVNGTNSRVEDQRAPIATMDPALQQQPQQPTFGQHDNDAANGLYLLAQAGNGAQANSQFGVPNATNANMNNRSHETSPQMSKGSRHNGSIGGQSELSGDMSDSGDQGKPSTRAKGKRVSGGKATTANGKRKSEETPNKQSATKKQKNSTMNMDMDGMDSEEEQPNIKEEQYHADGKKMTDEEKRKNFLERNRRVLQ